MYRTATMCRVLGVSSSGYYAWRGARLPACADRALTKRIQAIHERSRGNGVPRVHVRELEAEGVRGGPLDLRVARLMRGAGLAGVEESRARERARRSAAGGAASASVCHLVDRNFTAEAHDRLWVADFTYVPTWAGFLYDAFRRRIVGVVDGHTRRGPIPRSTWRTLSAVPGLGVIHHSDQRHAVQQPLPAVAGVRPPWARGLLADNALMSENPRSATCFAQTNRRHSSPPVIPTAKGNNASP